MLSSGSFIASSLTFIVYSVRECSVTCSCPVSPAHLIEKTLFSPLYILTFFVRLIDHMCVGLFLGSYPVPLIYMSVFVPVPYCFNDAVLQHNLKSGSEIPPILLFFHNTDLAIHGLFLFVCLHTNLKIFCSSSVKSIIGNLIDIVLNLQTALGNIVILTVLILPIHEYDISFHLFVIMTP